MEPVLFALGAATAFGGTVARSKLASFAAQRPTDYAVAQGERLDLRAHLNGPMICDGVIFGPLGRVSSRFTADFNAEWTEMMLTAPPVREEIPIWIAALKDKLTSMALEIGDGLMVHALWTVDYTVAKKPFIEAELARFGRKRSDVEVNAWPWIAINDDKQQAINDSRATVAAYVGYKEYEAFFDAIGFGDEARACQLAGGEHGDVSSVMKNVSDEMVEAFVKCGPVDDVLEKIEPFWDVIDSLCPMTPYRDLTMEQLTMYNGGLYQMVAEAKRRQAAS